MSHIPTDRYYTKTHEWVKIDGDTVTIGITDYAQHELGDIVYVELPATGDTLDAGDNFASIEAVKAVEEIYTPVGGEITETNEALEDNAELINKSCYEDGWIIKIRLADRSEIDELLTPEDYTDLVEE